MSILTKFYNFIKPELTDAADITATNENWDKVDSTFKSMDDNLNAMSDKVDTLNEQTGLFMRGWNPISNISDDTPSYWKNIGNGYWLIDYENVFIGQPRRWGFFTNMVQGEEVAQTFIVQATGETYRRNANSQGWYGNDWRDGTWTKIHDETDNLMPKAGGTFTGTVSASDANTDWYNLRNICVTANDGVNAVSTGRIIMVRK